MNGAKIRRPFVHTVPTWWDWILLGRKEGGLLDFVVEVKILYNGVTAGDCLQKYPRENTK